MRRISITLFVASSLVAVYACEESSVPSGLGLTLDGSFNGLADSSRPETDAPIDATVDAPQEGDDAAIDADAGVIEPDDGGAVLIGSGFGNVLTVIADNTNVYFTTYGTKDGGTYNKDGTVVRCPISGGCAASQTVLATGIDNPLFLAIDGSTLVIGQAGAVGSGNFDGHVYACPLAGCGANNASRKTLSAALMNLGGITARNGYGYWVHNPPNSTCWRALLTGGTPELLGNANAYSSVGVTVDDQNAYWTHTYYPPAIHVAPFTGDGGRVLVDVAPADAGLAPVSLTHDNGYLYYASVIGNNVNRVRVDGTGLQTLASGLKAPSWIALDATNVYVADYYSPHSIRRVPKTGGSTSLVVDSEDDISWLAVNGTYAFWSTTTGQVWRIKK